MKTTLMTVFALAAACMLATVALGAEPANMEVTDSPVIAKGPVGDHGFGGYEPGLEGCSTAGAEQNLFIAKGGRGKGGKGGKGGIGGTDHGGDCGDDGGCDCG